jgi:hypothetical protein
VGSGFREGKNSDPGSGINILDPQHCALEWNEDRIRIEVMRIRSFGWLHVSYIFSLIILGLTQCARIAVPYSSPASLSQVTCQTINFYSLFLQLFLQAVSNIVCFVFSAFSTVSVLQWSFIGFLYYPYPNRNKYRSWSTMKRLDQGHLYPKLEVPRLTCLGRESNPGLRGGRQAI